MAPGHRAGAWRLERGDGLHPGRSGSHPRAEEHGKKPQIATPSAEHVTEAASFVRSLAQHSQLGDQPGSLALGATHQIEVDEQGRRKLVRRRYSAI